MYFVMVMVTKDQMTSIFEQEILTELDSLFNFAYYLTGNESDADDLVQDTMLRAFRAIATYQQGTNARAWLFKIAKNHFINDYRKRTRKPQTVDLEEANSYNLRDMDARASDYPDLRIDLIERQLGDEIKMALEALPVDFRVVLIMADLEDFQYEEIAEILDLKLNTVRSRLRRARAKLADQLETYAESLGYTNYRFSK